MPHRSTNPVHLGLSATASVEPAMAGPEWFDAYAARHAGDGIEGRLVAQWDFAESWTSWEMHPLGAEVVICTAGAITLVQELGDGSVERVPLGPGDYAINPPGVWHTADIAPGERATCIFITAGAGTEHRAR